jgi:hypothetical protein
MGGASVSPDDLRTAEKLLRHSIQGLGLARRQSPPCFGSSFCRGCEVQQIALAVHCLYQPQQVGCVMSQGLKLLSASPQTAGGLEQLLRPLHPMLSP